MRIKTLCWIAYRDLRSESKGKRAWMIIGLSALLMGPIAYAPAQREARVYERAAQRWQLAGDFDPELLKNGAFSQAAPGDRQDTIVFEATDAGLIVSGSHIPAAIREHLNQHDAHPIAVNFIMPPIHLPGRTSLLALISAAVLTGAVTESLAGERTRNTLETLLSAAITRRELIYGKWLAWATYGSLSGLLFALFAVSLGRIDAGLWLIALPTVPMALTAFGLYIVRHAKDVLAGATLSLRWLPITLGASTLISWWFSVRFPLLAASVPIGGAILATGQLWASPLAPPLAVLSTGAFTVFFLERTVADLVAPVHRSHPFWTPFKEWLKWTGLSLLAWQTPLLAVMLWTVAGNPLLEQEISLPSRLLSSTLCLSLLIGLHALRSPVALRLKPINARSWLFAPLIAAALLVTLPINALNPLTAHTSALLEAGRLPSASGIGLFALLSQEWLFRGLLPQRVGPVAAVLSWTLVVSPHDPIGGLLMGGGLVALSTRTRSIGPGLMVRALLLFG